VQVHPVHVQELKRVSGHVGESIAILQTDRSGISRNSLEVAHDLFAIGEISQPLHANIARLPAHSHVPKIGHTLTAGSTLSGFCPSAQLVFVNGHLTMVRVGPAGERANLYSFRFTKCHPNFHVAHSSSEHTPIRQRRTTFTRNRLL
jgi:hypothetical protein